MPPPIMTTFAFEGTVVVLDITLNALLILAQHPSGNTSNNEIQKIKKNFFSSLRSSYKRVVRAWVGYIVIPTMDRSPVGHPELNYACPYCGEAPIKPHFVYCPVCSRKLTSSTHHAEGNKKVPTATSQGAKKKKSFSLSLSFFVR